MDAVDRAVATDQSVLAHGDDRGLVEDDALAADVDEGVGRAQVDGQVAGKIAAEKLEHAGGLPLDGLWKGVQRGTG